MKIRIIDGASINHKVKSNVKSKTTKLKNADTDFNILNKESYKNKLQNFWHILHGRPYFSNYNPSMIDIKGADSISFAVNKGEKLVVINLSHLTTSPDASFQAIKIKNSDGLDFLLVVDFNSKKLYKVNLQDVKCITVTLSGVAASLRQSKHHSVKTKTLLKLKKIIATRKRLHKLEKLYQ